jgi:transcriptional regulator with XRE-family HTH domain
MWTELSDTSILNKLGSRLKAYRISSGLKQQELAAESGVGVSTIAKIESGQSVSLLLLISVISNEQPSYHGNE